ncbi:cytidine deoxycytidylate deaminase family protein [Niveomyces insectorum RCEF 264]|uniref:Cytidine deoxycytidylate deaminase family protein n=1 Tax=Niveomyces insectorum RCEF 264 TaxID=1081102 RepID=A0A167QRQ9_9HYPO|nr:cytidine deoxycytidylate deaminase family protein [Niveomyces insectorum RCEF 264]
MTERAPEELLEAFLRVTEDSIVPLTRKGVAAGSKVFGAAIFDARSSGGDGNDGPIVPHTVATNNERASPLLHGEINCIQAFFGVTGGDGGEDHGDNTRGRPSTKDCLFFATHEPCSLCLSGITWAGFPRIYYLFTYEDSRDLFAIPYDLDILGSVFRVPALGDTPATLAARPLYNKTNKFFTAASLGELVDRVADPAARARWAGEVARVKALYTALSETYQAGKAAGTATASVWK